MGTQRQSALSNRRFRLFLLTLVAVPLGAQYLLMNVVVPIAGRGFDPTDFIVYLKAARVLSAGGDPYASFFASSIRDATLNQGYIYAPPLAWLLGPLGALPQHTAIAIGVVAAQVCLAGALVVMLRALRVRSWEQRAWLILLVAFFYPVWVNLDMIQLNLVLFLLGAVWFAAWLEGDRWWGGAALGLALALKVLQGPWALLMLWGRRWRGIAAAVVAGLALWAAGAPGYLVEYWTRVFPALGAGSGFRENQTPAGLVAQILDPASFYAGQIGSGQLAIRWLWVAIAVAVVLLTLRALGARPRSDRGGRALEAAAVIAAAPLMSNLAWPSHLLFAVIPLLVLAERAFSRRDARLAVGILAAWLLLGPVHTAFLAAIASGFQVDWVLRVWAQTGLAGTLLLWVLTLQTLRAHAFEAEPAPAPAARRTVQPARA